MICLLRLATTAALVLLATIVVSPCASAGEKPSVPATKPSCILDSLKGVQKETRQSTFVAKREAFRGLTCIAVGTPPGFFNRESLYARLRIHTIAYLQKAGILVTPIAPSKLEVTVSEVSPGESIVVVELIEGLVRQKAPKTIIWATTWREESPIDPVHESQEAAVLAHLDYILSNFVYLYREANIPPKQGPGRFTDLHERK